MSFFGNTEAQPDEKRKLANISDDAINSNQQAVPVKYLAGRAYIAGDYMSPAYNPKAVPIKTQTGKGESKTTGYKYFADFALVFCMGGRRPVDAIYAIVVDSDIVWKGNITRGTAHKEVITVPNYGVIHLYWGDETQGIDSILLSPRGTAGGGVIATDRTTWPANSGLNVFSGLAAGDSDPYSGHYDKHPAYRGQCYAVFKNWKLGRDRTSVPNILFELKRGCPWFAGGSVAADDKGVNPIAILYDWLTDPRFGMEFPEARLSQPSFQGQYNALETLGARLSVTISEQSEFRQMVAELLEYFDGWVRRTGNTLEIGRWSHGTVTISATLTDDDLLGEPELEPQGWGPTLNEVTVVYADRTHHFNTYSQTSRDPNNRRITGSPRPITLQRPWLTDAALARQYAEEYCKIKAMPFCGGTLTVKREWLDSHAMQPGQLFTYNSAFYDLSIAMRLLEVEYGADDSARATLTVEWERAIWPSLYIPPPFPAPGGFEIGPRAIWRARIVEVPYLMKDNRFQTQLVALAIKGANESIGFRVWASFDGGSTYQLLVNSNNFAAYGRTLFSETPVYNYFWCRFYGAGLDDIVSQTLAEANDDTLLCFIDQEVMSVGTVLYMGEASQLVFVYHGRFGTTRQPHASNSDAYFIRRDALHLIDHTKFIPGATVLFKLQPFTADQDYDLAAITPISYNVVGWSALQAPQVAPPGGGFAGGVAVLASADAGAIIRYTTDGTQVFGDDPIFPANGLWVNATTTLRLRAFAPNGQISPERIASYTLVPLTAVPPQQQCGSPTRSFSGTRGQTSGNLTLSSVTAGSIIKFRKNRGPIQTYSSPISLACTSGGDIVEYWATKLGLLDSAHVTFDNTRYDSGGGGGGGGGPPHPPP